MRLAPSGSGKPTLLSIPGGLDRPSRSSARFAEHDRTGAGDAEGTRYRRELPSQFSGGEQQRVAITRAIVIMHSAAITGMADRVLHLGGGRIQRIDINAHKISPSKLSW